VRSRTESTSHQQPEIGTRANRDAGTNEMCQEFGHLEALDRLFAER